MNIFFDKTAIVTGAGSGIGRALGEELARRGAHVVLSDVNSERIKEVGEAISQAGGKVTALTLDVTDYEAVKKMVDDTVERHGRVDYIFNNAGIAIAGEAKDFTIDDWRKVLGINLHGVMHGVVAAYPIMVRQGFGHIINMASIEGLLPLPITSSYVTSKFGVVGMSNALRLEGAAFGVKVSAVCPGFINTNIWSDSKVVKLDREKGLDRMPSRFAITPEKCAAAMLRGVEKNKAIIVVTGHARFLWFLYRLNPNIIIWIMRKVMERAREEEILVKS